jgi:hypothetical protein
MPFRRLNKEYNQQGIYMSETNNSTNEPVLDAGNVVGTRPNILSLVSLSGEDEPTGFALLMTPYKAKLLDVESLIGSLARAEQETRGKITPQDREILITDIKESLTAADLLLKSNLYTTRQVNDRENVPRIVFPLPIDIRDQLMVSYQSSDMGISGALASFGADLAKNIKQGRGLDLGVDTGASALSALALNALKNTSAAPLAGQYFGAIANPFTVTAFRNVEPRMFNFEFRITPANQKQSETLQECINTLRYCALPDPTSSGLTLDIPYRFKLAWLGGLKMFDFSEAVLTRIEVNYSSGGSPAFFEFTESSVGGSPGYHPVAVTVALEFKELFPLTKETIIPRESKSQTYDGEMFPRKIGRDQFNDRRIPASSPETQGGSTTTDAAENQTGTADNALNTPVSTEAAAVQQAQTTINDSLNKINVLSAELANEGEGGYDAQRAILRQITASDVYLAVNKHDNAVAAYNALIANPSSPSYIQNIPTKKTWLEKVDDGTSGSRTRSFVWYAVYNTGNVDWNKTSGGGP